MRAAPSSGEGILKIMARQWKQLLRDGYAASLPDEASLRVLDVTLPLSGAWSGIQWQFRLSLPADFPFSHPTLQCLHTAAFHPNVDPASGNMCMPMLSADGWRPSYTLSSVCESIGHLFAEPDWSHALNPEAAELWNADKDAFSRRVMALGGRGLTAPSPSPESDTSRHRRTRSASPSPAPASSSSHEGAKSTIKWSPANADSEVECVECVAGLSCGHALCRDCWRRVAESRQDLLSICCPGHSALSVIQECRSSTAHKAEVLQSAPCTLRLGQDAIAALCPERLHAYRRSKLDGFVATNRSSKLCPLQCGRVCLYPKRERTRVITCACGGSWCWGCLETAHYPISCDLLMRFTDNVRRTRPVGIQMSSEEIWLAKNVKTCQNFKCKKRLWKHTGCIYLMCDRNEGGCGEAMCWLCCGPWDKV